MGRRPRPLRGDGRIVPTPPSSARTAGAPRTPSTSSTARGRSPPPPRAASARLETVPETGKWYHLVGVRKGDEITLYVDGKAAATTEAGPADVSTEAGPADVSAGPLSVGRAQYDGAKVDFWNGSVDQVEVNDRALTVEEVPALHGRQKP